MSFLEAFAEDLPARVKPRLRNVPAPLAERPVPAPTLAGRLLAWGMRRPGVELARDDSSPGGLRALAIAEGLPLGPPQALLAGRQFAHFLGDGSVRLRLPAAALVPVVERGWGVCEPLAGALAPDNTVRLHGPRDEEELQALALILDVARAHACGEFSRAS